MLPKQQRMTTRHFDRVFSCIQKKRQWFRGAMMDIGYARTDQSAGRVATVVRKKRVKSAVLRNRLRRQMYAQLSPVPGFDAVCLYKGEKILHSSATIAADWSAFQKMLSTAFPT